MEESTDSDTSLTICLDPPQNFPLYEDIPSDDSEDVEDYLQIDDTDSSVLIWNDDNDLYPHVSTQAAVQLDDLLLRHLITREHGDAQELLFFTSSTHFSRSFAAWRKWRGHHSGAPSIHHELWRSDENELWFL